MPCSLILILLSLFLASAASAQTHIDAGVAVGMQSYESSLDDPRVLTGGDVLIRRAAWGVHVAAEYADVTQIGATIVVHANAVYRHAFASRLFILAGAGPTYVSLGETASHTTWNAEAEAGRRFGRTDVFLRVRSYDYSQPAFRDRPASPDSAAVYLGVRFAFKE